MNVSILNLSRHTGYLQMNNCSGLTHTNSQRSFMTPLISIDTATVDFVIEGIEFTSLNSYLNSTRVVLSSEASWKQNTKLDVDL